MNKPKDVTHLILGNGMYSLDPITAGTGAIALANKVPAISDILNKATQIGDKFASKVGLGGVEQDRFIERRDEINKLFSDAGYPGVTGEMKEFKIDAASIPDKKKKGNYQVEFDRLHKWMVAKLNRNNPGLGTAWEKWFPKLELVTLGNISGNSPAMIGFKELIKTFPPGTFNPGAMLMTPSSAISEAQKTKSEGTQVQNKNAGPAEPGTAIGTAPGLGDIFRADPVLKIIALVILIIIGYHLFKK